MNNEALREFDVDEVKKAANKLDVSDRGSDEEYNRVLLAEFAAFARLRRRAMLGQELMDDLMSNEELRERYLKGEIGVNQFVAELLDSEEGDRKRREIEKKFIEMWAKKNEKDTAEST